MSNQSSFRPTFSQPVQFHGSARHRGAKPKETQALNSLVLVLERGNQSNWLQDACRRVIPQTSYPSLLDSFMIHYFTLLGTLYYIHYITLLIDSLHVDSLLEQSLFQAIPGCS